MSRHHRQLLGAAALAGGLLLAGQSLAQPADFEEPIEGGGAPEEVIVVLLPDPDREANAAIVTNPVGSVLLDQPLEGATVRGQTPPVAVVLTEEEVEALFGEALAAAPERAAGFLLFFEFDSTELVPGSAADLAALIAEVRRRPAPRVRVEGHADTAGPMAYNEELAARRARTIAQALTGAGLPEAAIAVESFGEREPLEPTPDGTPAQRNRRVEVTIR